MPNPYGAVQDALRGTQETIRYIGSDMSAQRRRLAESKLLNAQMDYKKAAAESDIEFKATEREFTREKIKAFKAENAGKEVKFEDGFNMYTLGMPEEQRKFLLNTLETAQPGISKTMQRTDHMETAFKLMADRLTKGQEAKAEQYTPVGEAEKIKLGLTGPYQRSGKNKIEMVERPTEAKPISAAHANRIDTLTMEEFAPQISKFALDAGVTVKELSGNPGAYGVPQEKVDFFNAVSEEASRLKQQNKTMSDRSAVKEARKTVTNGYGDTLLNHFTALGTEADKQTFIDSIAGDPFVLEIFQEAAERQDANKIGGNKQGAPAAKTDQGNLRADGTKKGPGFLGTLKRPDGKVSTELSIGIEFDGKEIEIPTLVPTLTKDEKEFLLKSNKGDKLPKAIIDKAVIHARKRIADGKSPFFEKGETTSTNKPKAPEIPRSKFIGGDPEKQAAEKEAGKQEWIAFANKFGVGKENWKDFWNLIKNVAGGLWGSYDEMVGDITKTQTEARKSLGQ